MHLLPCHAHKEPLKRTVLLEDRVHRRLRAMPIVEKARVRVNVGILALLHDHVGGAAREQRMELGAARVLNAVHGPHHLLADARNVERLKQVRVRVVAVIDPERDVIRRVPVLREHGEVKVGAGAQTVDGLRAAARDERRNESGRQRMRKNSKKLPTRVREQNTQMVANATAAYVECGQCVRDGERSARRHKIVLHVDDQQGRLGRRCRGRDGGNAGRGSEQAKRGCGEPWYATHGCLASVGSDMNRVSESGVRGEKLEIVVARRPEPLATFSVVTAVHTRRTLQIES